MFISHKCNHFAFLINESRGSGCLCGVIFIYLFVTNVLLTPLFNKQSICNPVLIKKGLKIRFRFEEKVSLITMVIPPELYMTSMHVTLSHFILSISWNPESPDGDHKF